MLNLGRFSDISLYTQDKEKQREFYLQVDFLESRLKEKNISLFATKLCCDGWNIYLGVSGNKHEVCWMDMDLLMFSYRERIKHLLILNGNKG